MYSVGDSLRIAVARRARVLAAFGRVIQFPLDPYNVAPEDCEQLLMAGPLIVVDEQGIQ